MSLQFSNDIKSNDNEHNFTVISKINNIFFMLRYFYTTFSLHEKENSFRHRGMSSSQFPFCCKNFMHIFSRLPIFINEAQNPREEKSLIT